MDRVARRRPGDEGGGGLTPPVSALFDTATARARLRVTGVVQGVGFRPFVHRLAHELGLAGRVLNDGEGVLIDLFGDRIAAFRRRLITEAPPLARIEQVTLLSATGAAPIGFEIAPTPAQNTRGAAIPADIAPCAACLAETRDPSNRRFGYAFTSCTDCGPRYTITRSLPFDRGATAMADFAMCEACDAEYRDPASRRFHSQTNCCAACGPTLSHSITDIAAVIRDGGIVALKGLGGYHLACDARNEAAVAALRQRKRREAKPFAVMVGDLDTARNIAVVDAVAAEALVSPARPIVILDRRNGEDAIPGPCETVSGGLPTLGVMLPSSLVQAMLVDALPVGTILVMTSGNLSGEPVITDNDAAIEAFSAIADLIVTHDRAIVARADDGVVRPMAGAARQVRRGRGIAPASIRLKQDGPDVLALGAHLKVAACVLTGRNAILTPHVGDLDHPQAVAALEQAVDHLLRLTGARPVAVAHDWHPDFASTRLSERFGLRRIGVQHHHAHALAVAAENGHTGGFLAIALDGFGLGERREAWGGEIIDVTGARFERIVHLADIPEPGGDIAAREPWRIAAALLSRAGRGDEIIRRFPDEPSAAPLTRALAGGLASPVTTSAGRWFDAAAALLGIARRNRFEGEAAMLLEGLAIAPAPMEGGWRRLGSAIDLMPLALALADETDPARGANLFHGTLIDALATTAIASASALGRDSVALCGGCFLNRRLVEGLSERLGTAGLRVLLAKQAPANDGGLALGQAVAARLVMEGA
jgi:hydrogenase maturation protein HypF